MIQNQTRTQEISWSEAAPLKPDQVRITVQLLDCYARHEIAAPDRRGLFLRRHILDVNLLSPHDWLARCFHNTLNCQLRLSQALILFPKDCKRKH